ncbi:VOC family protein [Mycolicibacterium sp. J2]|uniref:VOC family protein n=1 Tax=Mycolicibacterium sp. J2 TaxID=2993511 RepID=UPI00224AAD90|nr:VOC family protein [Mycolicibacterium sp. J2]MCX2714032.1 VOC family protein [Mycolicibacterium sp. J2]
MAATDPTSALKVTPQDLENMKQPNAPAAVAHIVFKTPRPEAMAQWYGKVLDAIVTFQDRRLTFLTYDNEHHRIALIRTPALLKIPGQLWRLHRKFWGVDHIAFTYPTLKALTTNYLRLANSGIYPVWCINHGPTTSMYYEDPDGNRLELQVDNFIDNEDLLNWLEGGEFADNPIGVEFDPDELARLVDSDVPTAELVRRGSAPPCGRQPRAGTRTIRWKTL